MKPIRLFILGLIALITNTAFGQIETDTVRVYGNCGMCKKRIEKAVKLDGVAAALWSSETQLLIISYDSSLITNDDIQKAVVAVGHDTEKFSADDKVYSKLPGCCRYERKKLPQQKQ